MLDHQDEEQACKALEKILEKATLEQLSRIDEDQHRDLRERLLNTHKEREIDQHYVACESNAEEDREMVFENERDYEPVLSLMR